MRVNNHCIYSTVYFVLESLLTFSDALLVFLNLITHMVQLLWTSYQLVQRPIPTQEDTTYKHKEISVPQTGYETAIPATKRRRPTP